ncbi:hypothetical protein GCM10029964_052210 [Kibdelosporangium lantanae]
MSDDPAVRLRRHTLFFLDQVRAFAPVFLDTEVDASAIVRDRARARNWASAGPW